MHCNTVNRSGFHRNSSLGGSLSCLIPAVIKGLAGEGMSMTGRDGNSSIKIDIEPKTGEREEKPKHSDERIYKGTEVSRTLRKVVLVV